MCKALSHIKKHIRNNEKNNKTVCGIIAKYSDA